MDQQTIDTYNKIAREYDEETANFWSLFPRIFLDQFIKLSGTKIIDVGSGSGRDALIFQQAGKEVVCLDASEAMVRLCSEKGLQSVLAEFDRLPFEQGSFDGVWAYTSLLHIPKKSIATSLEEIFRVLKPAGVFGLGLIEGDTEGYYESSDTGLSRWFSFYQKDEVIDLCRKKGFELVYLETFKPRSRNYLHFIFQKSI